MDSMYSANIPLGELTTTLNEIKPDKAYSFGEFHPELLINIRVYTKSWRAC